MIRQREDTFLGEEGLETPKKQKRGDRKVKEEEGQAKVRQSKRTLKAVRSLALKE